MKTAISLPDSLFYAAERLAKRLDISRSKLYADAVSNYLKNREMDIITETLNEIYEDEASPLPKTLLDIQARSIGNEQWE